MRLSVRSIPRWILLVILVCPFFVGCCSQAFLQKVGDIKKKTNAPDVALIILGDSQQYFPDTQIVRKEQHIVVWIAMADKLEVTFQDSSLPKPVCPTEVPFLCYTQSPFPASTVGKKFKYTARLWCSGRELPKIDPEVEIVF